MNREEIMKLEGRELDALVAEKAMDDVGKYRIIDVVPEYNGFGVVNREIYDDKLLFKGFGG